MKIGLPRCRVAIGLRIKELADPDYVLMTPTGMLDMDQHWGELRLFAKEVMPHFRD